VLFNEPKLLKSKLLHDATKDLSGFSALQRAEIAEMVYRPSQLPPPPGFSALQRAEIAEMRYTVCVRQFYSEVSVLFNEPKLLKYAEATVRR